MKSENSPIRFSPKLAVIRTPRLPQSKVDDSAVEDFCEQCMQHGAGVDVIRVVNNIFNEQLRDIINGNADYKALDIGCPSSILLKCGVPNLLIQISAQRLVSKKMQSNHPFSLNSVINMPECISNPIAVFQSKTRANSKVVLTEMEEDGVNFIVAIEKERNFGEIEVNSIRTVFPKDNIKDILRWIGEEDLMEYCDKQKILKWLDKQQSNSADVAKLLKDCTNIIHQS